MSKRICQGILCGAALCAISQSLASAAVVIYQDPFTEGPVGTAIGGNAPLVASGLAGGTLNAPWQANTATAANPDAIWQYNTSGATIISPSGIGARDTNLIADAYLPFTPQAGYVYDYQLTLTVPSSAGDNGHWCGMAFASVENGGTGGGSAALSNDQPTGLIIVRDDVSSGYSMNIFQGPAGGTSGQANYNVPGGVGTPVTLDIFLNTLNGLSAETMDWEINGVPVGSPVSLAGNPAINYVSFGDDTAPAGTVSNLSLTASVPEPASIAGVLATGGLLSLRRRRLVQTR